MPRLALRMLLSTPATMLQSLFSLTDLCIPQTTDYFIAEALSKELDKTGNVHNHSDTLFGVSGVLNFCRAILSSTLSCHTQGQVF